MAPDPKKRIARLSNKVIELEDRLKILEHFMGMDEEAIKGAMEEKEDYPESGELFEEMVRAERS